MILMTTRLVPGTRSAERGSPWQASAIVDGREYRAQSRSDSTCELARVLVAAGIADRPVEVWAEERDGVKLSGHWPSLHAAAQWTYRESASHPIRRVRWQPVPDSIASARTGNPKNRG